VPTKAQRCRDYDEKGFCMRGDQCKFDHGNDAVILADSVPAYNPAAPSTAPSLDTTVPPPPAIHGIPPPGIVDPYVPGPIIIDPNGPPPPSGEPMPPLHLPPPGFTTPMSFTSSYISDTYGWTKTIIRRRLC